MTRSSLTPHVHLMRDPDPMNALRAAREAYETTDGELVLINRNWLTAWTDQKQLDLLAERAGLKPRRSENAV